MFGIKKTFTSLKNSLLLSLSILFSAGNILYIRFCLHTFKKKSNWSIMVAILNTQLEFNALLNYCIFPLGLTYILLQRLMYTHKMSKSSSIARKLKTTLFLITSSDVQYLIYVQLFFLISFKLTPGMMLSNNNNLLIFISLFVLLIIISGILIFIQHSVQTWELVSYSNISLIVCIIALIGFLFINNLLTLVFVLELMSLAYYFFFLNILDLNSSTSLKYKSFLSNYLMMSFFTTMFLILSITFIIFKVGVVNFKDIVFLSENLNPTVWIIFLTAFLFKLGVGGFHFYKLEIYQLLPYHEVILFSVLSFFVNTFIILFLVSNLWHSNFFIGSFFFSYVCVWNIYLLLVNFKQLTFGQFFALSSFNAVLMLLFFSLINVTI